jgi:glycosyltransferase involved in cell wall biosynthesis
MAMTRPHPKLSYVTHIYHDQEDTRAFDDVMRTYAGYAPELLDQIEFVIVDDGSPVKWKPPDDLNLNLSLFHVEKNIEWNQSGARNLGVLQARSENVLLFDADHLFPEETLRYMLRKGAPGKRIVRFWRRSPDDGSLLRPHGNSFQIARSRFLKYFGYDEDCAGRYGHEDQLFWRWQRYHGTRFTRAPRKYFCNLTYDRRDTSYHSLERDKSGNEELATEKKEQWKKFGSSVGHSRRPLRFPWTLVKETERESSPPTRSSWAKSWWLRWLSPF